MKLHKLLLVSLGSLLLSLLAVASVPDAARPVNEASSDYQKVTDRYDRLSLQAPLAWNQTEAGPWIVQNKEVGVFIAASPNLSGFYQSNDTPGVFFAASRPLAGSQRVTNPAQEINPAIPQLLGAEKSLRLKKCKDGGRFEYQNPFYTGQYDVFKTCSDGQSRIQVLVSMPPNQEILLYLVIKTISPADEQAAAQILNTYQVLNTSLVDEHGGE